MRSILISLALAGLIVVGMAACKPAPPAMPETKAPEPTVSVAEEHEHEHHHAAPHGGSLIELGDHVAHIELVLVADTGTVTAYLLDGEAENALRVPEPALAIDIVLPDGKTVALSLSGVASGLTGETVGDTSQFSGMSEALKGVSAFTGTLKQVTVKGSVLTDVPVKFPNAE